MKKALMYTALAILALIALATAGEIIIMALGALLAYHCYKEVKAAASLTAKSWWSVAGIVGVALVFSNFPSLIGLVAIGVFYYLYTEFRKGQDPEAK